jgi:hypothetical protein
VRIDVRGSQELKDIVLAINRSETDVQRAIRTFTKARITTPWLQEIHSRASTKLERRVIASTSTVAVSNQNIRIASATKGRTLRGGLNPKTDYAAIEFGASREKQTTYRRKGAQVTRHTARQLRGRNSKGYVFYPAATEMIPRLASLWVQTVVKTYADIFDGKS